MEITTQHAEAVCERAGVGVKERFLLDRIALHAANVAPRHAETAILDEAHLAHAVRAFGNRTAMSAREAAQARLARAGILRVIERLDQLGRRVMRVSREDVLQ